jgi:hypothetical protein
MKAKGQNWKERLQKQCGSEENKGRGKENHRTLFNLWKWGHIEAYGVITTARQKDLRCNRQLFGNRISDRGGGGMVHLAIGRLSDVVEQIRAWL